VLLVEDNPADQILIRRALQEYGDIDFEIEALSSTKGLRDLLRRIDVDIILIDYSMPGETGLDFLRSVADDVGVPPIIMLTGSGDELIAKEAILAGAYDYFLKSRIEASALGTAIRECLEKAAQDRKARRQKLETERLAVVDGLTDLYNRRYLADALRREWGRVNRYGGQLSCLMIDVDGFKQYNDLYGHLHGDAILRLVAKLVSGSIRDCDIAARYGGDEFCILLTETDHQGSFQIAERLRSSIAEQCLLMAESAVPITVSIGVFTTGAQLAANPEDLIYGADAALRQAKAAGKNQVFSSFRSTVQPPQEIGQSAG
jgi:diguanylate cyclase (GGDEF)-like protein